MANLLFSDTETTNRDPKTGAIHNFGAILEIDGREVDSLDLRMRPNANHEIDDEALDVSGVTRVYIDTHALSQGDGACKFAQWLYRHQIYPPNYLFLVGWNVGFDEDFIREWLGASYYGLFFSNSIDIMSLAGNDLQNIRTSLPDFKLGTVCKHYGIQVDETKQHGALYDARLVRDIYKLRFEK